VKIAFLSHFDYNLYLFRLPVMKELVKKGHKVYAICPKGAVSHKFKEYGIVHIDYQITRSSLNPLRELKSIYNIYKAIKPLNLDILQNFMAKPNIYGSVTGRLAKIPLVVNAVTGLGSFYISSDVKSKIIRYIIEIFYRMANSRVDCVIFQNGDDMKYFIQKGIVDKNKAVLIKSSGIDTEKFKPMKIERVDEQIRVLMIARAIWHKGIREFYEAAKLLKDKDIKFILVGDIDKGNPTSADESFLKGKNVEWLGHRDDIKELIASCDIFVLPSYREGVPRTLLEAASMGKPIVTTDTVGCREVVKEGYNGFLVPVRDSRILAEKIDILIKDRDLRERFGKNSRDLAIKQFDVKIVVKKYLKIYEKLM